MKKLLFIYSVSLILVSCGSSSGSKSNDKITKAEKANPAEYASTITSSELKTMLYKYASDEFEGRNTGEKGQKLAVEYLKEKYKTLNIPTPLGNDDYFQEVPLEKQKVAEGKLTVNGKVFNSFDDLVVLAVSSSLNMSVEDIVYVGFGIDDDKYSDYKGIDVKDKIVLAKAGEPKDANGNFITSGNTEDTKWTNGRQSLSSKREAATANGAKGLLYMDSDMLSKYAIYYQKQHASGIAGRLSLKSNEQDMIMLMVSEALGKAIYASISKDDTPKNLKTTINIEIENKSESIISENVVAYIKGSEKPDEIVVISAHLDHEGNI